MMKTIILKYGFRSRKNKVKIRRGIDSRRVNISFLYDPVSGVRAGISYMTKHKRLGKVCTNLQKIMLCYGYKALRIETERK